MYTGTMPKLRGIVILLLIGVALVIACTSDAQVPTATTVLCPTDEESEYIDDVRGGMVSFGTQLTIFGEDLQDASATPIVIFYKGWQLDRATQIDAMVRTVERVAALQAPASAGYIAGQVDEVFLQAQNTFDVFKGGILDANIDRIEAGTILMMGLTEMAGPLGSALDTFCE